MFKHVKGHQDSWVPIALTQLMSMNVEMDLVAKSAIDREKRGPIQYHILGEPWCCYIDGQ